MTVAVLSSATLDAVADVNRNSLTFVNRNSLTFVNRNSLTFGKTGDEDTLRSCAPLGADVNRDRRPDLLCDFAVAGTGLARSDTIASLNSGSAAVSPHGDVILSVDLHGCLIRR